MAAAISIPYVVLNKVWINFIFKHILCIFSMQEELILEIVNNPNCQPKKYSHSYLRSTLIMVLMTLMVRISQ